MTAPTLLERLKQARIVQVLLVYLGASWVVLQFVDTLVGLLSLPAWVGPVAVVLMAVGLMVVLATAWVQSLPSTTAKEEAGEIPTDWQVAPADALASLKAGKLPHLTWGRAIVGGVVALSLLFGGTGLYMGSTGRTLGLGPTEVGADMAAEGIAVVPFDVRGENLEIWREGMVDLLSNNLDGVGGFRTIDPRTVMARWKEGVGDGSSADLDAALRAAGATGARYALVGSVVGIGDNVRLVSNVYDLDTRQEVAQGQAQGTSDQVLRLVDDLAVGTIRSLLQNTGREGAGDLTAETLTTESLPALREFLEGERHYRKGDFAEAVQSFERAVAADTSFAIGLVRLSEAYGWLEDVNSEKMREYGEKAMAHTDRLPPRYQFIMEGWDALNRQRPDGLASLKAAVQKYPDDPEAWFLLAETYIHVPSPTFATLEDIQDALDHAVALDPNFAPYFAHVADVAIDRGDRAAAEAAVARYEELSGSDYGVAHAKLAIPLLLGDDAEAESTVAAIRSASVRTLDILHGTYNGFVDRFDRLEDVIRIVLEREGQSPAARVAWGRVSEGDVSTATQLAEGGQLSDGNLGILIGHTYEMWNVPLPAAARARKAMDLCGLTNFTCYTFMGVDLARPERAAERATTLRSIRQTADEMEAKGDTARANDRREVANVIEGLGAWRQGDLDKARRLLEPASHGNTTQGGRAQLAMAEMELSQGRWDNAIRYAQGQRLSYARPRALYIQAKAYEGKGDAAKARETWRHFVAVTRRGNDDIPAVREGREALVRLGGRSRPTRPQRSSRLGGPNTVTRLALRMCNIAPGPNVMAAGLSSPASRMFLVPSFPRPPPVGSENPIGREITRFLTTQ